MESSVIGENKVLFVLSIDEANFIKELVQNPIGELWEEPVVQAEMRHHIFDAIKNLNL